MSLLAKGVVETDSPVQSWSGFYSRYFLIPKKDGGLRPILDIIRHLNCALMKRPFRMNTSKQILAQICPGDWGTSKMFSHFLKKNIYVYTFYPQMLILSSSARRMRTLSVYNGSRQGMSKNSQLGMGRYEILKVWYS